MKNFKIHLSLIMLILFSGGCNLSKEKNHSDNLKEESRFQTANEKTSSNSLIQPVKDKPVPDLNSVINNKGLIIRSGTMSMETEDFSKTETNLSGIVKKYSGYITNSSSEITASGMKQSSLTARIPYGKFDEFLIEASATGKVISQDISGNDVTSEYIDLEARQKTQRELERRLIELLNSKTAGLTDVVEVEEKLSSVREKIESTEGRMNFLKDSFTYSTLTINLFEPSLLQTSSGGGFFYELGQGVKKGLEGFTEIFSGLITFAISFSPVIILLILSFTFIRKYFRKRNKFKPEMKTS